MMQAKQTKPVLSWHVCLACVMPLCVFLFLSACYNPPDNSVTDRLNEISYAYHYRNLDSTRVYAERALKSSDGYDAGKAEALNNLVFVSIAKMDYGNAYRLLDSITKITDNQIELLVADIYYMRLCQRESRNKEFYDYHGKASQRIKRINEEKNILNGHLKRRMTYADTEFNIVTSTYYYYVGLEQLSAKALSEISPEGEIRTDTAQLLAYYYNIGSGGMLTGGTQEEIYQQEFDYLLSCYIIAKRSRYIFWEANALQAISEHLQVARYRNRLIADNMPSVRLINTDNMPDSLIAGNLAQRSLELFKEYGDVYQTAGVYRTLAQCYWLINDYPSAIICLDKALNENKAMEQAPNLIASVREQLSVVYSAMDDKPNSDYNRNLYLDMQEHTRQDMALEARAEQLGRSSVILNRMITAIVIMIITVLVLLYIFDRLRARRYNGDFLRSLLEPLKEWQRRNSVYMKKLEEHYEAACEEYSIKRTDVIKNKRRNLEQRAKISLVNGITPFVDRIINEINLLKRENDGEDIKRERYEYIRELTDKINDYNTVLTEWIQLKQGELRLQIETFRLNDLFDIVRKNSMSFRLKGIEFTVEETGVNIKADKILTLFMINTLADNARKFTGKGGKVRVSSLPTEKYVEISVTDTGIGIGKEKLARLFDRNPIRNGVENMRRTMSHGFGLINCMGIINKYRKTSRLFDVCMIAAESVEGRGSRFFFRLPVGIVKMLACLLISSVSFPLQAKENVTTTLGKAASFADSAYFCNINAEYGKTLSFADSCRKYLNKHYLDSHPENRKILMKQEGDITETAPEIQWFQNGVNTDYDIIMSIRNESAVAALALHQWSLYRYNNKVYTQLFKEVTADWHLGEYCRIMQVSESNKNVAIVILLLLFFMIFPSYYFLYYRHYLYYRFCVEQVRRINGILLDDTGPDRKLEEIRKIKTDRFPKDLLDIVVQITDALKNSVGIYMTRQTDIELVEDESRRAQYEKERLYVCNNVLDNCLSTLKHETMYYPSRIRQLIDSPDKDMDSITELAAYYKELYTILSMQAMRQVESVKATCRPIRLSEIMEDTDSDTVVLGDEDMLAYLFEILQKINGKERIHASLQGEDGRYVKIRIRMTALKLTAERCAGLFYPTSENLPYLLCRQIIRDTGEASNMRGCGIIAEPTENGVGITITLAKYTNYNKGRKYGQV